MSDANKALAEVRSWLCDNLGSYDAGKVCGMLSVVSRRIYEIEGENAKLREENAKLVKVLHEVESEAVDAYLCLQHDCELLTGELENRFRKYWHEQVENAKLRELAGMLLYGMSHDAPPHEELLWSQRVNRLTDELGIEVDE